MSIHKENRELINSGKFTLWMFIVSIIMIFAALTSAYLVRRAEGNWLEFEIPSLFVWSTLVIVLSSITFQFGVSSFRTGSVSSAKIFMTLTVVLGLSFLITQWYAWGQLVDMKVFFGGSSANPAGSFMYVLTGMHALHIISAIIYLAIVFGKVLSNNIDSSKSVVLSTCATYWHFLGGVWIYLYIFLILKH